MNKFELDRIKGTTQIASNRGIVRSHPYANFNWYFWSDQHFGAMECNYNLATRIVDTIKRDKTSLVTLGGDIIDAIPRGYKIDDRGQHCTPDLQIARTVNELKPIANKIVCLYKGNHNINARGESVDSDFLIAQGLGVPYKTVPTVVQVKTPRGVIKAAGGHGKSGAKNGDTELEQVRSIFPNCHIYHLGHNHQLYVKRSGALVYDSKGKEAWDESWMLRTGNCLNYAEYARYSMYRPQRSGLIKMVVRNGRVVEGVVVTEESK